MFSVKAGLGVWVKDVVKGLEFRGFSLGSVIRV